MANPVRYPQGISTAAKGSVTRSNLWNLPMLDPTKLFVYFEDFTSTMDLPIASSGLGSAAQNTYTLTVTEAGAGNAAIAVADTNGGVLTITNDAADNDAVFVQHKNEMWLPDTAKRAWFKTRFKVSDATQSDWIVGMYVRDTTPLDVTDGIFFQKDDGDTQIDVYSQKDTTTGRASATNIATNADATFVTLGWYLDGLGKLWYYVNDVEAGSLDASSTYLPDTELTVGFGIQNGEAVAKTMSIDYVFFAAER